MSKRDYEQQLCYNIRQNILSELFGTIEEYILLKYLYDSPYHFCKNKYPYLSETMIHMVFWIHPEYEKYWSKQKVIDFINHEISDNYKIEYVFKNDINNKSVKNILHYQVYLIAND